ncbi:MAG: VTT domain-containing protein [Gammaproteobacteria bacterium]|nr:VTT domain-containing protein [Gammaproteobacteria bacterium]
MDSDFYNVILNWVSDNPNYSYFLIFLISLAESLVVVGLIIPGLTIMLAIGTVIGAGYISLWPAMFASILGAVVGDGISYQIGRHFQQSIRNWYVFRKYPEIIIRCENFFARHGKKSVAIGRFAGPVRPMIPAIAGMMKMPPMQFYFVNIISAILWSPSHLLPGILFGNALQSMPPGISKKLTVIVFITLLGIWFISIIIKKFWRSLKRRFNRWGTRIWMYAEDNSYTVLQNIIKHPLTHKKHQVDSFLFLILAFTLTILFIIGVKTHFTFTGLNPLFKHLALLLNTSTELNRVLLILDSNVSEIVLLSIFLGYFVYFSVTAAFNRDRINTKILSKHFIVNRAIYISTGLLAAFFLSTYLIAHIVKYPMPYQLSYTYANLYSTSFPNTSVGLLALLIGYVGIIKYSSNPKEYVKSSYNFYAGTILIFFCLLKLYLGYIWLSDIFGAILISCCLLLIFCIFYWQKPIENINKQNFNIASLVIILSIVTVNTTISYLKNTTTEYNLATIRQNLDTDELNMSVWQAQSNLFSNSTDPIINIQWLGDLDTIKQQLTNKNWYQPPTFGFKSMLSFLEVNPEITNLPVLPTYYQDHLPVLVLSKKDQNNRILTLRLWQSPYIIANQTLWVGTIEYFKPQKIFNNFTVLKHWPQREFSDAPNSLIANLDKKNHYKIINVPQQNLTDDELKIILISENLKQNIN